jgi:hypothetical protein
VKSGEADTEIDHLTVEKKREMREGYKKTRVLEQHDSLSA